MRDTGADLADLEWAVRRTPRRAGEGTIDWLERVLAEAGVRLPSPAVKPWPALSGSEQAEIERARNEVER